MASSSFSELEPGSLSTRFFSSLSFLQVSKPCWSFLANVFCLPLFFLPTELPLLGAPFYSLGHISPPLDSWPPFPPIQATYQTLLIFPHQLWLASDAYSKSTPLGLVLSPSCVIPNYSSFSFSTGFLCVLKPLDKFQMSTLCSLFPHLNSLFSSFFLVILCLEGLCLLVKIFITLHLFPEKNFYRASCLGVISFSLETLSLFVHLMGLTWSYVVTCLFPIFSPLDYFGG